MFQKFFLDNILSTKLNFILWLMGKILDKINLPAELYDEGDT